MDLSTSPPDLSVALVAYLREQGHTLRDIGNMVGLSESFISRVANDERSFTLQHLAEFERHLGEPLAALVAQAMWGRNLRPDQQQMFDDTIRLLRDLGDLRQSIARGPQASRRGSNAAKQSTPAGTRKRKRAAG